jgi:hypothetical protein
MRNYARHAGIRLGWFVIILVVVILAVDGGVSRTEALDRWVGTAAVSADGEIIPFVFIILVDPGKGASWEWRYRGVQIMGGPLAATVSGSTVNGTLFVAGGLAAQDPLCCAPCNFSGTIAGNRVDGVFDPVSCGGTGTFVLVKQ